MMMRKVYTTPAYFTMLLLKFFNLLLIFLSSPYVARNRCRFGWLAGGGFLVCGLFWVVSWGASGPLGGVDHWLGAFDLVSALFRGASGPLDGVDHWLTTFRGFWPCFESSPKSCVKICRLSYSLFAFGEVDQEGSRISLPGIV